ncbi:MAG TPA: NAD-dependent epimerase/dehydratase family protein, partial [Pyrinomonadaceae bacterium]|nr:NAD-dependent epimerase/dehydratase family protein [Pyrinomonadaceae bacterium]
MALSGIALITGGAGFVGSHIATALVDAGARVRVVDDLSTGYLKNLRHIESKIDFIEGSVGDAVTLGRALTDVELIFHQAAIPSVPRSVDRPMESHDASVNATFALLLAARDQKVRRVVYAASSSAYGDQPELPKREDMRPAPLSPYAVGKLVGEYYGQVFTNVYGLETVSLRYFNVFGPRQDPGSQYSGVISRFMSALVNGEQPIIYGDGGQSRDFTFVSNVVDANMRAAESPNAVGKVMNVANGRQVTLNELLEIMKKVTGKSAVAARYEPV